MSGPGVTVNQQDGNLGLTSGSNTNIMLIMGVCLGGVAGALYSFGDPVAASNTLLGGEGLEAVQYVLKASPGATAMFMPVTPSTRGGVGSVTKTGAGAMTVTPSLAPQGTVTITCVVAGTLGTAQFTFGVTSPITGVTTTSAAVLSAAGWSSTGYFIPGTYTNWVATAGSYVAGGTPDVYVIATTGGAITHPTGAGPAVGTYTSSPVDFYRVLVTVLQGGAVGTSQITYSLDNGGSTSAALVTSATYAIPNTGIVLALSGTANAGDTYSFSVAPPTFSNTDLTADLTLIETTLLASQTESLIWVIGSVASAAAWVTQTALLESAAVTLAGSNIYVRFISGGPTVGTVLQNAGSITVDSADTDNVVIAARAGMSAPHVCVCAGDGFMTSSYSGLQFRRNTSFAAAARAVGNAASQDIGAFEDGGVSLFTSCARDDFANGSNFWTAGITSLRTYGPGPVFINQGLMGTVSTSDYYTLTNARVIDRASTIGAAALRPYILKKLPTMTRNGQPGTIREDAAQKIDKKVTTALRDGLVTGSPQDAVAAVATTTRTNNIYSTRQLIVQGAVQPFGYPAFIIFNIGMTLQAS
jgi:hypothetical protein